MNPLPLGVIPQQSRKFHNQLIQIGQFSGLLPCAVEQITVSILDVPVRIGGPYLLMN
jgi:hypothetical protein